MKGACTRVLDMIFVTASSDLTGEPLTSSDLTGEPLTRTPVSWAQDTLAASGFILEGNRAPVKSVPGVKVPTDRELMWKDLWTADMGYVMKE